MGSGSIVLSDDAYDNIYQQSNQMDKTSSTLKTSCPNLLCHTKIPSSNPQKNMMNNGSVVLSDVAYDNGNVSDTHRAIIQANDSSSKISLQSKKSIKKKMKKFQHAKSKLEILAVL